MCSVVFYATHGLFTHAAIDIINTCEGLDEVQLSLFILYTT